MYTPANPRITNLSYSVQEIAYRLLPNLFPLAPAKGGFTHCKGKVSMSKTTRCLSTYPVCCHAVTSTNAGFQTAFRLEYITSYQKLNILVDMADFVSYWNALLSIKLSTLHFHYSEWKDDSPDSV